MPETSENWNQQFAKWFNDGGKSLKETSKKIGIPRSTLGDYIHGRITDLGKMTPERRNALYSLTKLECFKQGQPRIEMSEPGPSRTLVKKPYEKIGDEIVGGL